MYCSRLVIEGIMQNPFIYKDRESSLLPEGFLTAQLMQKWYIMKAFVVMSSEYFLVFFYFFLITVNI